MRSPYMHKLLLTLPAIVLLASCEKECELTKETTLHVDFDGFASQFVNIAENEWLDPYDTSMARMSVKASYDFVGNEKMVHPADSADAEYVLTIDSVIVKETYHEETQTENCNEEDDCSWLWTLINPPPPPDTYHFRLEGIYVQVVAHVYSRTTGQTYSYSVGGTVSDRATTEPPAGTTPDSSACYEWREEPAPLLESTPAGHVNHAIHNLAHAVFEKFKCDAIREGH